MHFVCACENSLSANVWGRNSLKINDHATIAVGAISKNEFRNWRKVSHFQIAGKRDTVKDAEAQEWIEALLGEKFPASAAYEDILKDGQVLCRLINKIKPGSVAKVNESGGQFKMMENINNFQKALKAYGVPEQDFFQTVDLFEKKDISQVTNTLFALGRAVSYSQTINMKVADFFFVSLYYRHGRMNLSVARI